MVCIKMKKLKKVCFIVPDLGCGGAQRVVCNLANEFAEHGIKVVLFAFHNGSANCFYSVNESVEFVTLPDDVVRDRNVDISHNTKIMRVMLEKINPDLAIAFLMPVTMYCYFATRELPIKLILSERNDPCTGVLYPEWVGLRDQAFGGANACVFQTEEALRYYGESIRDKSKVINNPIVLKMFAGLETPQAKEREKRIINIGRYDPQKNHPMLMNAFFIFLKTHPGYKLEIYGRDFHNYLEEMKRIRSELQLDDDVEFCGTDNNLFPRIYNAKMFVLASDYEGMPNALLEGVVMGLPSISTDCPIYGSRRIIKNGENGILTEVNNPYELAKQMANIADNDEFADRLSQKGREIAHNYDIETVFREWMELISTQTGLCI